MSTIQLRIPDALREKLLQAAAHEGIQLDQFALLALVERIVAGSRGRESDQ